MNTITLVGRLGKDVEQSTSKANKPIAKFSIATNDGYGDNKKTNWHNCVAFGKTAEILAQYVSKGSEIAVNGSVDYNQYEDKQGVKKTFTSVLVNNFTFIGGKNNQTSDTPPAYQAQETPGANNNDPDEDLPF
jgi:single-strand DNA-binding protein